MHRILTEQVKQYLGDSGVAASSVQKLLDAVSESYEHFEQECANIKHTLTASSDELKDSISLLEATLNTTYDGILVIDTAGTILHHNKPFLDILALTEEAMKECDGKGVFDKIHEQALNGQLLAERTHVVTDDPEHESSDTILLKDGRIIERHSQPHTVGGMLHGRVWSFRDVTKRIAAENQLKNEIRALEKLNKTMIDRELRMVELKEKIRVLEEKTRTLEISDMGTHP